MQVGKRTAIALCPDCDEEIDLGPSPKEGQKVTCPSCDVELEVISVDPLELGWDLETFDDDGDDDDDDWDDDDGMDDDWDDDDDEEDW
jgi:lysine biosynthesis protein LysW